MYTHRNYLTIVMSGVLLLLSGCFEPDKPTETAQSVFLEKNKALSPKIEYFSILSEEMRRPSKRENWRYIIECDVIFSLEDSYVLVGSHPISDRLLEDKKQPIEHLGLDYDTLYTIVDLGAALGGHQKIIKLSEWNILENNSIPKPGMIMILHKGVKYRNTIMVIYKKRNNSWETDIACKDKWGDIKNKKRNDNVKTLWL